MSLFTSTEHRRRSALWRLVVVAVVVVVAAAVGLGILLGAPDTDTNTPGSGAGPSAPPSQAPTADGDATEVGTWTVPPVSAGPLIAPQPTGTTRGVPTGFPHTTEGAISAAARYAETAIGLDEEQARAVGEVAAAPSYLAAADDFAIGVDSVRNSLGLAKDEPTGGAYVVFTARAYRVDDAAPDRVVVQLLGIVEGAGPATSGQGRSSTLLPDYTMVWADGDWKIAGDAGLNEPEPLPSPGTSQAYERGWRDLAVA